MPQNYVLMCFLLSCLFLFSQSAKASCDVVARIYQKDICREQLNPEKINPERQVGVLFSLIWYEAMVHKFGEGFDRPTEEEIQSFNEKVEMLQDKQLEEDKEILAFIKQLLSENSYSTENQVVLEERKARLETSIARDKEQKERETEYPEIREKSRKRIAVHMISAWKRNKALYDHYGGQIIFQQFGLEPIDAYRSFMEEIKTSADLEILDPSFKGVFGEMERYNAMGHNSMPDNEETRSYFQKPFWLSLNAPDSETFKKRKEALEKIPTVLQPSK